MKKYVFLFALMTASIFALAQTTALYEVNVKLTDGQSINLSPYYELALRIAPNPDEIIHKHIELIVSPQVKELAESSSFDGSTITSDEKIQQVIMQNAKTENISSLRRCIDYCSNWLEYRYATPFLHRIVQNKTIRDYIFEKGCGLVAELCEFYTTNAKQKIINNINEAIGILKEYSNHNYQIIQGDLYIDGVHYYGDDMQGWIARRVLMDKVPVSELQEKAMTLLQRINAIDTKNKPQVVCCIRINNEIEIIMERKGKDELGGQYLDTYISSINSRNRIDFYIYTYNNYRNILNHTDGLYCLMCGEYNEVKFDSNCNIIR